MEHHQRNLPPEQPTAFNFRMAELVFRPLHVIRQCWQGGRRTVKRYWLPGWAVFLIAIAFGLVMQTPLSDPRYFSSESEPSFIGMVGEWSVLIWIFFVLYLLIVTCIIQMIGWLRD